MYMYELYIQLLLLQIRILSNATIMDGIVNVCVCFFLIIIMIRKVYFILGSSTERRVWNRWDNRIFIEK